MHKDKKLMEYDKNVTKQKTKQNFSGMAGIAFFCKICHRTSLWYSCCQDTIVHIILARKQQQVHANQWTKTTVPSFIIAVCHSEFGIPKH